MASFKKDGSVWRAQIFIKGREVSIGKKKTQWEQTRLEFIGSQLIGGKPPGKALMYTTTMAAASGHFLA